MANKSVRRNWNDIQIIITTSSMALTLAFWNLFAGPDRETAMKRAQEQAALPPPQPAATEAPVVVEVQPILPTPQSVTTLPGNGPILLGGSAPQTQIIVQARGGGGGGGGGGSTRSS
jgi:hypothetical protein